MVRARKPDGGFTYELEPHEISFLSQFVQGLSSRTIHNGDLAAQGVKRATEPFRDDPDIVSIEYRLRELRTLIDMKASVTPSPEIATLKAEIAALNERLNDLIPNFGVF